MVKSALLLLIVCCASSVMGQSSGQGSTPALCQPGSEFEPALCSLTLPGISELLIAENAARSALDKDRTVNCASFKLSTRQARRFLRRAKLVDPATAHSTLDWSPCYASGTVRFVDGRRAHWTITSTRVGSLIFDGQAEQQLYCPKCTEKPFVR